MTPIVVLIGTLDTKGEEYAFIRDRLHDTGLDTLLVDVGTAGQPSTPPDVTRAEVAAAGGIDPPTVMDGKGRGAAVAAMGEAAALLVRRLYAQGRCDGILAAGGSGNTAIATRAMQALPLLVPKVMVSTMASGDTAPYVGASDVMMIPAVSDIAGLNRVSRHVLASAATAIAAMVRLPPSRPGGGRLIAATMFGVTTPAVTTARRRLEELGHEVVTFHATGTGGRAMEDLIATGQVDGVLDLTTTELADDLVGGILGAGPDRLTAAGRAGIPQVVSVGALDMVNFGPPESVPARFAGRRLLRHNPQVTLMRTTAEESAALGAIVAERLRAARGPTALFLPLHGVSEVSVAGGPFADPEADDALFDALRSHLTGTVELHELDLDINDPRFATAMAERLHELIGGAP